MSLEDALRKCFEDEPSRIFSIEILSDKVQKYYTFSAFQQENDPKYPQPRYRHEIRHVVSQLKEKHFIIRLGRDQYRLV